MPLRDDTGVVTHYVAVKEIVTERRRQEDLLRKLFLAVNQSPESIVITDTIPLSTDKRNRLGTKLKQLSVSRLLGEAIRRIHHDLSISAMFNEMEGQLLN